MKILIGGDGAVSKAVRKLSAAFGLDHAFEVIEKRFGFVLERRPLGIPPAALRRITDRYSPT